MDTAWRWRRGSRGRPGYGVFLAAVSPADAGLVTIGEVVDVPASVEIG